MPNRFTLPLVFLPGSLCDERIFEHQKRHFEKANTVEIIRIKDQYSIWKMAEHVLATSPSKFILIGFSMGGIVALQIMRMAPERVLGLALLSTNAWQSSVAQIQTREQQLADVRAHGEKTLSKTISDLYPSGLDGQDKKQSLMHELIKDMALNCGVETFCNHWSAINTRPDLSNMLDQIQCPTLVLFGEQDLLCASEKQQAMSQQIPNATLVSIDNCGHFCTLEEPALTTRSIENLITSIQNTQKQPLLT